jgi:hypothetical protein
MLVQHLARDNMVVAFMTNYKTLILLVLCGGFLNYLLKDRMRSRETGPSFFCGAFASFDNSRS